MIFHLNLFLSRQKTTTKKSLMWNTMFIGPFMVCEIFAYKLYENYVKELKIKAKTNKLFKIPLVFYSPRQRVSWTSEADPQYLFPEAEGFLELWGWSPVLSVPRTSPRHLAIHHSSICRGSWDNQPVTNHSFYLFMIIWKKMELPVSLLLWSIFSPEIFKHDLEFNKLSWGHRVQQWWKMERGHATYSLGNLRYSDHLSFSFQFYKIEKLYMYMYVELGVCLRLCPI